MAKGPSYTDEEQRLLDKLAKKGGSPTVLAKEFLSAMPSADRSETALVQKIRKMILEIKMKSDPSSVPAPKKRAPKVNASSLSDVPPAAVATAAAGSKRVRKPSTFVPTVNGNGEAPVPTNGHNGNGEVISVDLGGLTLIGSKKRVGEALQQLG